MARIKKITKYFAVLDNDDKLLNEFIQHKQEFDEHQNCLKEIEYNPSGEVESASGYKYNDQNKMIEEIHYFDQDEVGEIIKYKLNDEGKPEEIETVYADDARSVKKISRSEFLLSTKIFDEDGELEGEESIKFDQKNRPVEEIQIDESGKVVQRSVYEYNTDDQVVGRTNYGENNEFLVNDLFEYDDRNNLVKIVQLNEKGKLVNANKFEYDERGNQVLMQSNQHITRTAYDKENRIISEEHMSRAANAVEKFTEYKYGDHGLVIEERTFSMGDPYQLEPGVFARTGSNLTLLRYEYEFY